METHYLADILVLLAAAIIAIPVFQRLGLGSVQGYLAAASVVGPWGLGFIDQIEKVRHIAEFGVIFLLFIIGIELKPARLWAMRSMVFGLATAQLMVTGLAIASLALLFGQPPSVAVIIGFGLALSSTAFVPQILTEHGEMGASHGQTAFSLLLQDLAVVPLLTLVSLLAAETTLLDGLEFAALEAMLVIALVVLFGRFFLSPFLRLVARAADRYEVSTDHIDAEQPHVIIAGFGRVGRRVASILQAGNVPCLAIESNADRVQAGGTASLPPVAMPARSMC